MTADTEPAHDALNQDLIAQLRRWRSLRSDSVEAAIRAVPRHLFVPEVPLEQAYANDAVITKRHPDGSPQSSASAPAVVAAMLEQLDVQPGHRVLEIGAGTGYNAALLAKLGADVTTIEYDEETAERARHALAKAGVPDVLVVTGDGADGYAERAPYDRLIVTTGAWDVPAAWLRQLAHGARVVVPLRLPGWSYSFTFEAAGDHWRALDYTTCGFIPMAGSASFDSRVVRFGDTMALWFEDDRDVDKDALEAAFAQPRQEIWTGITVDHRKEDPYDSLMLWLASKFLTFCKFSVQPDAAKAGQVSPLFNWGSAAVHDTASFAYLTNRRIEQGLWELGVVGHGEGMADRVAEQLRGWTYAKPTIELHPAGTPDERLQGAYVIDKRDTRIAVFWPET